MSDLMSQSYHDVMEVYKRPMSVRYIPTFFWAIVSVVSLSLAFPQIAHAMDKEPVIWVQVPQWSDDWETAPWFDANGLNDVAPIQKQTVAQKLQEVG